MVSGNDFDDEVLQGIMTSMGEQFEAAAVQYLEDLENFIIVVEAAIKKENADEIIISSDDMKVSSRQFGALGLCDLARQIEYFSSKDHVDYKAIASLIDSVKEVYSKMKEKLECYA